MENHIHSYLSEYVHEVIVQYAVYNTKTINLCSYRGIEMQGYIYINDDFLMNWNAVEQSLGCLSGDFNILEQPVDWYKSSLVRIWAIVHDIGEALMMSSHEQRTKLFETCSNLKPAVVDLEKCFQKFVSNSDDGKLQALLMLTSSLERFLGNAYLIRGQNVPFLLRDLLATDELLHIFGRVQITFTQLLVGCPLGLNVRNIAWHGFLSDTEIHPHLIASLFILFASLNNTVVHNLHEQLTERAPLRLDHLAELIRGTFPDLSSHSFEAMSVVNRCHMIPTSHLCFWQQAFNNFFNERYGECLIIILPQLEHLLRILYCCVNDCQSRMLTAEATDFYTTLDQVLSSSYNDGANCVIDLLGCNLVEILQDLLFSLEGPRLRDKISHGEICVFDDKNPDAIKAFSNCIGCVSLCILAVIDKKLHEKCGQKSELVTSDEKVYAFIEKLDLVQQSYQPKYHSISYILRSVKHELEKLLTLHHLSISKPSDVEDFKVPQMEVCDAHVNAFQQKLIHVLKEFRESSEEYIDFMQYIDVVSLFLMDIKFLSFNRPRHEGIVVTLMRHVLSALGSLNDVLAIACSVKHKQWSEHNMRSRARHIYYVMLIFIEKLLIVIMSIISLVLLEIKHVKQLVSSITFNNTKRFMKYTLKYIQNTTSYCSIDKNKWLEVVKLTTEYSCCAVKYLEDRWPLQGT